MKGPPQREMSTIQQGVDTRVLIAEDHTRTREALSTLLERKHFAVTAVDNGSDAIEILTSPGAPSIGLIDWMLPGASGLEICRAVRARTLGHYVYLIVITGRDGEEDITEALAAGADDFIRKPCGVVELLARVRNGQRRNQLERTLLERITELERALERSRRVKS
jgi:DNA-binding response OmpR family regulator